MRGRDREREREPFSCVSVQWEGKETNGDGSKKTTLCRGKQEERLEDGREMGGG